MNTVYAEIKKILSIINNAVNKPVIVPKKMELN